ncbi:MarR family transcriptional regulator [Kocuria coralli]|uniref:MarR family transcriptional regulator n=1 Tax=Kocuria coralli TaxID=1461025 RepID=A0A5J5KYG2_9MICC|nr:IclR family transcriptional regulator C-terminal domain-containing protein [Kocuria coralli]KAA9394694.1 MarR family transcriptional regulator [Kocuria coralli]
MAEAAGGRPRSAGTGISGRGVTSPAVWEVLRILGRNPAVSITQLAAEVGLHKSSVSRLLSSLREEQIVDWDERTSRYRLGLGLLALAAPLLAQADVIVAARQELESLVERTGESSSVMVWNHSEAVCVEQVVSAQPVKHSCALGERFNTAESASVQMFLAHSEQQHVRELLRDGRVKRVGSGRGAESVESYLGRLATVRQRGWAVNASETSEQETSVAAPIWDSHGLCAALMVSAPSYRTSTAVFEEHAIAAVAAAARVSHRMGGSPPDGVL